MCLLLLFYKIDTKRTEKTWNQIFILVEGKANYHNQREGINTPQGPVRLNARGCNWQRLFPIPDLTSLWGKDPSSSQNTQRQQGQKPRRSIEFRYHGLQQQIRKIHF